MHSAALEAMAPHGVNEARGEDGAGRADPMTMRDSTTLDIDDVLRQAELLRDCERHGC
jgi:hypothetical protein